MKSNYHIEQLSDSNLKDAFYLRNKIFSHPISYDLFRRKYDTSYLKIKNVATLMYDGDKVVGFYGALPQRFFYKDNFIYGAHTCDSLVLPEYQRKGIHKELALASYELMKAKNIKFVYAFHSENTFYSCKKLNWVELDNFQYFTVNIKGFSFPYSKIANKFHLQGFFKRRADTVLKNYIIAPDQFKNSNSDISSFYQVYDSAFFDYKNFTSNFCIEIENVKFWIKASYELMVGDVIFENEQDFWKSLEVLKKLSKQLGCRNIIFQAYPNTQLFSLLSKKLKSNASWILGAKSFDTTINLSLLTPNYGDLDTF